jgi:hypothetical protein
MYPHHRDSLSSGHVDSMLRAALLGRCGIRSEDYFDLAHKVSSRDAKHLGHLDYDHEVRALNATLDQAHEGSIQARPFSQLLLRQSPSRSKLREHFAKRPFRPACGVNLNAVLAGFTGAQVNILRCSPYRALQI